MNLRPYQTKAIMDLRDAYRRGKRAPVLVIPTGGGKTLCAAEIIRGAVGLKNRVLFLAHRTELLGQTIKKLSEAGVHDVRLIRGGTDLGNPMAPVTVASVQTLSLPRWSERLPAADIVIMDECHRGVAASWRTIAAGYPAARFLGLTATPMRGDGRALGESFDELVRGPSVKELIAGGYLVPSRVFAPGVALGIGEIAMDAVAAYESHGQGQRAIVFCSTVPHAQTTARELEARGISAAAIDGAMPADARARLLADFRAGRIRVVTSVHIFVEGFDDPGIAVAILARKMGYAGAFLQAVGRVLRPAPGKTHAIILDLAGSVLEHGTPEADREFSLDGKGIKLSDREPIRQCPTCGGVFVAAGDGCPHCGSALPRRPVQMPRSTGVGLVEQGEIKPVNRWVVEMTAKFAGPCARCPARIRVGEPILWAKGEKPRHADCSTAGRTALARADQLLQGVA